MPAPPSSSSSALLRRRLPFSDTQDFEDANRGLVAPIDEPVVAEDGTVLWDNATYDFLDGRRPGHGEPEPVAAVDSWWRSTACSRSCPGIYQVRGMDLSNITLRRGRRRASSSSTR